MNTILEKIFKLNVKLTTEYDGNDDENYLSILEIKTKLDSKIRNVTLVINFD